MPQESEKYQPAPEEIFKAEGSLEDWQKQLSALRVEVLSGLQDLNVSPETFFNSDINERKEVGPSRSLLHPEPAEVTIFEGNIKGHRFKASFPKRDAEFLMIRDGDGEYPDNIEIEVDGKRQSKLLDSNKRAVRRLMWMLADRSNKDILLGSLPQEKLEELHEKYRFWRDRDIREIELRRGEWADTINIDEAKRKQYEDESAKDVNEWLERKSGPDYLDRQFFGTA